MTSFTSPEMELRTFALSDILTASAEAPSESTAAATEVPETSVPTTTVPEVTDAGLDNEISAKQWEF